MSDTNDIYKLSVPGNLVDNILKKAFTNAAFAPGAEGGVLTLIGYSGNRTVSIPAATSARAGLLTPATLQAFNDMATDFGRVSRKVGELAEAPVGVSYESSANSVVAHFQGKNGNLFDLNLSQSSRFAAGLMTAENFKKLNNSLIAYKAVPVQNAWTAQGMPLGVGELCYDIAKNALLIRLDGQYYRTWGALQDPNGLGGNADYEKDDVVISAGGKFFAYYGGAWTSTSLNGAGYDDTSIREALRDLSNNVVNSVDVENGVLKVLSNGSATPKLIPLDKNPVVQKLTTSGVIEDNTDIIVFSGSSGANITLPSNPTNGKRIVVKSLVNVTALNVITPGRVAAIYPYSGYTLSSSINVATRATAFLYIETGDESFWLEESHY